MHRDLFSSMFPCLSLCKNLDKLKVFNSSTYIWYLLAELFHSQGKVTKDWRLSRRDALSFYRPTIVYPAPTQDQLWKALPDSVNVVRTARAKGRMNYMAIYRHPNSEIGACTLGEGVTCADALARLYLELHDVKMKRGVYNNEEDAYYKEEVK